MKKILIYIFLFLGFSVSCTNDFEDFNKDTKNPAEVKGEYIFSRAQKELMDQTTNSSRELNIWRLIVQYWTETTYTEEANYQIIVGAIPDNLFNRYYRWILKPLKEAGEIISDKELYNLESEASRTNELMIIKLLEVFAYHDLVNIFGDIPYSQAVDIDNISPVYDDAATIYTDLLGQIDIALAALDLSAQAGTTEVFGTDGGQEFFYNADVASWISFGNSLKLKIGIMLAEVNPTVAQSAVEQAVAAGVFKSSADNALFPYSSSSPNTNGIHEDLVLSGRKDFIVANTNVDLMTALNDPRMDYYFDNIIGGVYVGGKYGYSNLYQTNSHVDAAIKAADFPGILMTYNEILFYMAEAAERGWNVGMTAQTAYEAAVNASFEFWGVDIALATTYLAQPSVDYSVATNQQARLDLIGTQSYIAFYTRGLIAWNQYRRFHVPVMNQAPDAETPNGEVPTRFTYPVNEQTLNAANYEAAVLAIGGDDLLTRIFWDVAAPTK